VGDREIDGRREREKERERERESSARDIAVGEKSGDVSR